VQRSLKSQSWSDTPDCRTCKVEVPCVAQRRALSSIHPRPSWTCMEVSFSPKSRADSLDRTPPNTRFLYRSSNTPLSDTDEPEAAVGCVELCREIGNSAPLKPFTKREVMLGNLRGPHRRLNSDAASEVPPSDVHREHAAVAVIRLSVVDGELKVYGIETFDRRRLRSLRA